MWDRLEVASVDYLREFPEESCGHEHRVAALIGLDRCREAGGHIDWLLRHSGDCGHVHHLAAIYFSAVGKRKLAWEHVGKAISLDPEIAFYHYTACRIALQRRKLKEARRAIDRALELAPDDPTITNFHIRVSGLRGGSNVGAWRRVERTRQALALDPENKGLHETLGDIFALEIDDPGEAIRHYRAALALEPTDKELQAELFRVYERQNLLYRLICLPNSAWRWFRAVIRSPGALLYLVIGIKLVGAFLVWLAVVTVLFSPLALLFRWTLIGGIRVHARPGRSQFRRFHGQPMAIRLGCFLALNMAGWFFLFRLLDIAPGVGFAFVGGFAALHFVVLLLFAGARKANTGLSLWRLRREGRGIKGEVGGGMATPRGGRSVGAEDVDGF